MFNKVILTFSTRVLTAFLSIVNVLIGTNYLGVEGYGTISLIILGVTIYLMIQNIVSGSSIIYYISKFEPSSIAIVSYVWVFFSMLIFIGIILISQFISQAFDWNFEIVPEEYKWHNVMIALGYGLMAIHLNILLGRERIKAYNFIFFIQHFLATVLLVIFYPILGKSDLSYYLIAFYVSYFTSFLTAFIFTANYLKSFQLPSKTEFLSMFKYGLLGQSANVFQLINYRLSYYLIDAFVGRASLGVFSAATQISEGLWIFGKSIATVQFARISNSKDIVYARALTLRLFKFTTTITSIPLIILMFMPTAFYTNLLGPEFEGVRTIIRYLAAGTLSLTASMLLSHYFSGIGKIGKNTAGSGIGVVFTLVFGFALIPFFGLKAAAIVSSCSYTASLIYLIFNFRKEEHLSIKAFILKKDDITESWNLLTSKFKNKSSS